MSHKNAIKTGIFRRAQDADLRPPGNRSMAGARELLRALIIKDLKVKYKRSLLGVVWSLITPLALAGVYLFVFIYVYRVEQKDFIFFLLTGLFPWQFFNHGVMTATTSLIDNAPLIKRVYFPRYLLPMATVGSNLLNFLISLSLLSVVLVVSGRQIWLKIHWVLIAIILESTLCLGVALFVSVWNVYLRDIQQLIGIVLLVLFFATPVVYELDRVPEAFQGLLLANPLTGIIHIFRSALFEVRAPSFFIVSLSLFETAAIFLFGALVFRKVSPNLAKEL